MDPLETFEVQAEFVLDVLEHNLRMVAACEGQPKFPRFVRKMRAQLEHYLVLLNTFEEQILEASEKESEEILADSADSLAVNCYSEGESTTENKKWTRSAWVEHQLLLTELTEDEVRFYTSTKFRCQSLRIRVRHILHCLRAFEAKAELVTDSTPPLA